MKNLVIFFQEIKRSTGLFCPISCFMSKIMQKQEVLKQDVCHIKSIMIEHPKSNKEFAQFVLSNKANFKDILKPEKIYEGLQNKEVRFCLFLHMDELEDVSELIQLILIQQYFENNQLLIVLEGKNYYKVSHFLSTVNENQDYYNNIYYNNLEESKQENKIKRLAIKSQGALTHFLPLQLLDNTVIKQYMVNVSSYVTKEWFLELLNDQCDWAIVKNNKLLYGSMKIIHSNRKCFIENEYEKLVDSIINLNVLTLIFFAFSLSEYRKSKNKITNRMLNSYLGQMNLYAGGCIQLMENAVFHSMKHRGAFSFRIIFPNSENDYIGQKYGTKSIVNSNSPFMEIQIVDYSGENIVGNIAQNFIEKIEDEQTKQLFKTFTPIDFFRSNLNETRKQKIDQLWITYYEKKENLGRHVGIKIFENVITQCNGKFALESHATHIVENGESWRKKVGEQCLPGTGYTILLPVCELQKKLLHTEIGIDKDMEIEEFFGRNTQYTICEQTLEGANFDYGTQKEKEDIVFKLSRQINSICDKNKAELWYISAERWSGVNGELLCKAILISRFETEFMPHIVLYNCEIEFISACINTIYEVFSNVKNDTLISTREFQIAIFQKDTYNQVILIPENKKKTIWINEQLNFSREIVPVWARTIGEELETPHASCWGDIIPYDVLMKVNCNGQYQTLFEHYTQTIIERDIQESAFGCKIDDTHMRLGSTIHVDLFYEAELLFGNKLFVSRFAFLIANELVQIINEKDKITLYGYATYSELLIFEIMNMLQSYYNQKIDVDYAILEREMENRGESHNDRIRYSHFLGSKSEREKHFKDRKMICLVPVASTLKTNEKLIHLFSDKNVELNEKNILEHYVLILVGPKDKNEYWEIAEDNRIIAKKETWRKVPPKFYVNVNLAYEEAISCKMCFPAKVLEEKPLIEVNAASTIPNQAFGLYNEIEVNGNEITWEQIQQEDTYLSCLKDSLIYYHVKRGENHFLYYFQTEKLATKHKNEIIEWLRQIALRIHLQRNEYHVIFCPSHFSNAGFLEYINRIIFKDAAIIIRDDVDKEYRSNIMAKYSNIQLLFDKLEELSMKEKKIKFYFVDDAIITGKTFYRSKSLVESVADIYKEKYKNIEIHIFEKIFVLVDRNSNSSRMQYIEGWKSQTDKSGNVTDNYFAFRTLCISSLRNHGDSCVICNLAKEADALYKISSTQTMSNHWKDEREKFQVKTLKNYLQKYDDIDVELTLEEKEKRLKKKERSYRRMLCTHLVDKYIGSNDHGNSKINAIKLILQLLLSDYRNRKGTKICANENIEYFLSYLKIISRPFAVFNKSVKQAVFDILLILTERVLSLDSMEKIFEMIEENDEKNYLKHADIQSMFLEVDRDILKDIESKKEYAKDLFLVLLKQLTELRSNYIIRIKNINKIFRFIDNFNREDISLREKLRNEYFFYVKQLVGVSSDTSKSAWLDYVLHYSKEIDAKDSKKFEVAEKYIEQLYLENTRVFYDGINRIVAMGGYSGGLTDLQFGNFKKVLKDYNLMVGNETDEFTERGKNVIDSSISLWKMLVEKPRDKEDKQGAQEKYNEIACYINNILQAHSVKFIVEVDAEYDQWRENIRKQYKEVTGLDEIPFDSNKEYLLLANSIGTGNEYEGQECNNNIRSRLQKYVHNIYEYGVRYQLNVEEGFLIWEMESNQIYPVFLYAELKEGIGKYDNWNNVRNAMSFYHLLNERIFKYENGGPLFELITKSRDLQIRDRAKTYTHTDIEVRRKQYSHACYSNECEKYYQSNILTLLADLNVSEVYRDSLKKDFYLEQSVNIKEVELNNQFSIFFRDNIRVFCVRTDENESVEIKIVYDLLLKNDRKLCESDSILCYNVANEGYRAYLLIYSLILNAGVGQRTKILEDNTIEVYASKTEDGNLRIANVAGTGIGEPDKINEELKRPPVSEVAGISLWSMSRYIKSMLYTFAYLKYSRVLEQKETNNLDELEEYEMYIKKLKSNDFEVCVSTIEQNGEKYFSVEIPILKEKYKKFNLDIKERR